MQDQKITFIHTVFFWLKEGISDADKAKFIAGVKTLGGIETVSKFYFGPPAMTPRGVVDNSYDYAINVHFTDKAAHDVYQDVPVHHKFVEDCKDLWERVQVYDNLVQ